jgi:hypothetical protein
VSKKTDQPKKLIKNTTEKTEPGEKTEETDWKTKKSLGLVQFLFHKAETYWTGSTKFDPTKNTRGINRNSTKP